MLIHSIELQEFTITEINGEFKQEATYLKKVPCVLTNYALKKGKELGLIKSSLMSDLIKLANIIQTDGQELSDESIIDSIKNDPDSISKLFDALDESTCQKVIYLGCIGANPQFEYDFDGFIKLYQGTYNDTISLYTKLVMGTMQNEPNKFKQGFEASTSSKKKERK